MRLRFSCQFPRLTLLARPFHPSDSRIEPLGAESLDRFAPRWLTKVTDWGDTRVELPQGAPTAWRDALTGLIPAGWRLAELMTEFPVALLSGAGLPVCEDS
jgi:hypothetical protein